ncbi:hypothetical protein GCM10023347_32260 [Streptomyces chumphonensis]
MHGLGEPAGGGEHLVDGALPDTGNLPQPVGARFENTAHGAQSTRLDAPQPQPPPRLTTTSRIGAMSGSRKYSISLPEDLADAVRAHVGPGGFSAYVAEALEQKVAMDRLREIVVDFETDNEALTREEVEAARALLRHDHRQAGAAA